MKITRDLEITASEFFDGLIQGVVDDIAKSCKKEIAKEEIKKGFKFVHQGEGVYSKITFEVVDYQEEKYYKSKRSSINGSVSVAYTVKPSDKGISVTLEQIITQPTQRKPGKLMQKISDMLYLGRMSDNLYGIQKYALNKREGIVEKKPLQAFIPKKYQK